MRGMYNQNGSGMLADSPAEMWLYSLWALELGGLINNQGEVVKPFWRCKKYLAHFVKVWRNIQSIWAKDNWTILPFFILDGIFQFIGSLNIGCAICRNHMPRVPHHGSGR